MASPSAKGVAAAPASAIAPTALKPEAVAQPASAKPMPQATIKLQVAPKPAASATRKPEVGAVSTADSSLKKIETTESKEALKPSSKPADTTFGLEGEPSAPEVPLFIVIAAAALALIAFAIQAWTFIS